MAGVVRPWASAGVRMAAATRTGSLSRSSKRRDMSRSRNLRKPAEDDGEEPGDPLVDASARGDASPSMLLVASAVRCTMPSPKYQRPAKQFVRACIWWLH